MAVVALVISAVAEACWAIPVAFSARVAAAAAAEEAAASEATTTTTTRATALL
jgi:hypothetical protein